MCEEFERVVRKLFSRGETKKGCKYSPHQMHSELEKRFPERFDVPSVTEISGAVANLVQKKKKGSKASSAAATVHGPPTQSSRAVLGAERARGRVAGTRGGAGPRGGGLRTRASRGGRARGHA